MSQLTIKNLVKSYGKSKILHGVSIDVKDGEFISLLGPSGCGKTTTLRCVAGLERPDLASGNIELGNQVLSSPTQFLAPDERHFGMVFQSYAVWPHMNVFENVAFPLKMRRRERLSKSEVEMRVTDVLKLVHLGGFEKRFGHELSGGQQQRVALARALVMAPSVLLLDEPLSNLDVLLREELRVEIQRIQKKLKLTTILVTHDQREALSLSDRIVVMNQGAIEAVGTPQELYAKPPTDFVAAFLLGGQAVISKAGVSAQFIPRRWRESAALGGHPVRIISRLYLGNEYEYWAESESYVQPIKFFSVKMHETEATIRLEYLNNG